jgi:hypothetical protein
MDISIALNGNELIKCSYGYLEPFAPTTSRKITFEGITWVENDIRSLYGYEIEVSVNVYSRQKELTPLYDFKIYVLDHQNLSGNSWWVSGLIINEYNDEYRQGVVDVFNLWQDEKNIDWVGLPVNSSLKKDYIFACLVYSGVSNRLNEQDSYSFDMGLVKEENDFFYLAGKEFIGEKGYFGHDFHAFKDCLLTVFHQSGYFNNKKVVFHNVNSISDKDLIAFYMEIKEVFLRFKFTIEENL